MIFGTNQLSSGRRNLDVASGNRMDLDQCRGYPFLFRNRTNASIFLHSNDGRSIIYDYGDGI